MDARLKRLVLELQFKLGALDCATGKPPQKTSKTYLNGYSQQYASEQMQHARTLETF